MIVALAGHVDHGKTALIRALTGTDTDRLPEERARGMTIDLGFAYLHSDGASDIGFIDVPGHERFLANMLAGVLGIDHVLLVIAADDGPMPQTLEHLAILRLTGVSDIDIVISKTDAVPAARIAEVKAQAASLLPGATIHPTSAQTGAGIAALRAHLLDRALRQQARTTEGGFRLCIDRRFTLPGIGLVVTGTAVSGRTRLGDSLLLSPPRLAARVRAIHVQDRPTDQAQAGDRCALAITGPRLELNRVRRGLWLLDPALHAPSATLDLWLTVAPGQRLRHGRMAQCHLGAGHAPARVLLLGIDAPGGEMAAGQAGFVRVSLAQPIAALHGDRIALRDSASGRILAGGQVVDPFAGERRLPRARLLARLAALREPDPRTALTALLATEGSADLSAFARARNSDPAALAAGLDARVTGPAERRVLVAAAAADAWRARLLEALAAWHAAYPDTAGPNPAALLNAARAPGEDAAVAEAALADLLAEGAIARAGALLHLPDHTPHLAEADAALWGLLRPLLEEAGLRPPRVREVAEAMNVSPANAEALLERLTRFGLLLRVAPNRFFLPETVAALRDLAAGLALEQDGFTAAAFNQASGIGRNLTIEVLEYLDSTAATIRLGPVRHIREHTV